MDNTMIPDAVNVAYTAPEYCLITCGQNCMQIFFFYGFIVSGIFTILTILVSFYNITMHFINFNNPYFQSKIVIILLMPPIYCITSAASFLSYRYASYITLIRDFYQVAGLFAFFYLIFSFLAYDHEKNRLDQKKVYEQMCTSMSQIPHDCPCNYFQKAYQLSSWKKAKFFSNRCKRAILQYIIIKVVTSVVLSLLYPNFQIRIRNYSDWDYVIYNKANTYIYWFATISSYIAYYYMSMFYGAIAKQLAPYKPQLKFLTFNTTMFYTYWQKVWMMFLQNRILACFDHTAPIYNYKKVMYNLQDLLICIEMLFMALAGIQAYNYQDYVVKHTRNRFGSFMYVYKDIVHMIKIQLRLIKPKKFGFDPQTESQPTELMTLQTYKKKATHVKRMYVKKDIKNLVIEDYF